MRAPRLLRPLSPKVPTGKVGRPATWVSVLGSRQRGGGEPGLPRNQRLWFGARLTDPQPGDAGLRLPSRPVVLPSRGRTPSPPPPSPDLLRWERGAGAESWGQRVLQLLSGGSRKTRLRSSGGENAAGPATRASRGRLRRGRALVRSRLASSARLSPQNARELGHALLGRPRRSPWSGFPRLRPAHALQLAPPNWQGTQPPSAGDRWEDGGGAAAQGGYCSDSTSSVGDPAQGWCGAQEPFRFTPRLSSESSLTKSVKEAFCNLLCNWNRICAL